jgi:DNA-binding NarL/FixJ family response regulator
MAMEFARLLILADERLLGRGLATLLESRFDTHAVESFERADRLAGNGRREIILWVGSRVDSDTAAHLLHLRETHPGMLLCIVTHAAEPGAVRALLARAPEAVAVLERKDGLDLGTIVATLDDVLSGRSTLEPRILGQLFEASNDGSVLAGLTPSEQEILAMVASGLRNGEIARRLWKSEKAVEKQVSQVFSKLGLQQAKHPHIDRRVTAARIYYSCRPDTAAAAVLD